MDTYNVESKTTTKNDFQKKKKKFTWPCVTSPYLNVCLYSLRIENIFFLLFVKKFYLIIYSCHVALCCDRTKRNLISFHTEVFLLLRIPYIHSYTLYTWTYFYKKKIHCWCYVSHQPHPGNPIYMGILT